MPDARDERLWSLLGPSRGPLVVACALQTVAGVASVVPFFAVAALARDLLGPGPVDDGTVWRWGWVAVGALLVRVVCSYVAGAISHRTDVDFHLHVRRRIADRLSRAPLGWFTVRTAGTLKKRVGDDVMTMHHLLAHTVLELTTAVVVPITTLAYLFTVDVVMTLVVMLPLIVGLVLYALQLRKLRGQFDDYNAGMERLDGAAVEFVQGIGVVKTFGQAGRAHRRFLDAADDLLRAIWSMTNRTLRTASLAEVIMAPTTSLVVVMAAGTALTSAGALAPIDIVPFALVGRSGSGKSTLAKLLARFWDPTAGRITLGGVDLREIATDELYRHVSFVFQDVQLLDASVRDNIRLARPDATRAEVEAAAAGARIHERILELPRGYNSVIGTDARFSGGEAQRISIARALLADAPILVVDEATAFADPESEAQIQDALSRLVAGRTLLVVAHRLPTIRHADRIVVLDRGRAVERGTHDELVQAAGTYARLWANHERTSGLPTRPTMAGEEAR